MMPTCLSYHRHSAFSSFIKRFKERVSPVPPPPPPQPASNHTAWQKDEVKKKEKRKVKRAAKAAATATERFCKQANK